jgi:hypothetical protein
MGMEQRSARPLGVTILAVVFAVGGVLGTLTAVAFIIGALNFADFAGVMGYSGTAISSTMAGLGIAVYGALVLAFAYGAWALKPWGWVLGLIVFAVGAGTDVLSGVAGVMAPSNVIVNVLIAALLVYYWFRPNVRAAFRGSSSEQTAQIR